MTAPSGAGFGMVSAHGSVRAVRPGLLTASVAQDPGRLPEEALNLAKYVFAFAKYNGIEVQSMLDVGAGVG